jgi:hypothetical protein
MPLDPSRRRTPAQAAPPPAAAPPEPLAVAARPAPDGMGVVYGFAYTPAEPNPDDSLAYADYDAEGNLVARGRLPAAEAYRYTQRPLPAEGLSWSPHTRPDLGPGRWAATEELGADTEDDPPAPSAIVRVDPPDA